MSQHATGGRSPRHATPPPFIRAAGTLLALAALACSSQQKPEKSAVDAKGAEEASVPLSEVDPVEIAKQPQDTSDGGFALEFQRTVEGHTSEKLTVSYEWGGKGKRTVDGVNAGGVWRVAFPDKPAPTEVANLNLVYTFKLSDEEQDKLKPVVEAIAGKYVSVAVDAAAKAAVADGDKDATFRKELTANLDALKENLTKLREFQDGKGKSGEAVVLSELGLQQTDSGSVELTNAGYQKLPAIAELRQDQAKWTDLEAKQWKALSDAGTTACGSSAITRTAKADDLVALAEACRVELTTQLSASTGDYKVNAPVINGVDNKNKDFRDAFNAFQAAVGGLTSINANDLVGTLPRAAPVSQKITALNSAYTTLVSTATKDPSRPPAPSFNPREQGPYNALLWALARSGQLKRAEDATGELATKLVQRTQTLTQQELGSVLIERSPERRYYDFATGVVYTWDVDDALIPMMLAFCPWTCLRRGETVADDVLSSLSIDFGTRIGVLDKNTDPRHLDRPGLLAGLSVNPFYFVRLSGGMYVFENAQTDKWNEAVYCGVTINVLHAAELLGPLGFSQSTLEAKPKPDEEE